MKSKKSTKSKRGLLSAENPKVLFADDDFLDSLTNLMWHTGYTDEVAKDKLIRGLNKEVGLAWAQIPQKPHSLHEQMALIRDIGHNLENYKVLNKTQQAQPQKDNKGNKNTGNQNSWKNENGKRGQSEISTDSKDKSVELKGISKEILDERKKANMCLKCGKGPHKWFECFAKEPKRFRRLKGYLRLRIPARRKRRMLRFQE